MEVLNQRQKQEWKTGVDPRWVRTGCNSLWDAVFVAFRDYREAQPHVQEHMIETKTRVSMPKTNLTGLLETLTTSLYPEQVDDEAHQLFLKLIPRRLFTSELVPYLEQFIKDNTDREAFILETTDKSILLGEYRYNKKKHNFPEDLDVQELIKNVLERIFHEIGNDLTSYDSIQHACKNMEYHVIILSPMEQVLFDSKTWNGGIPDQDYNDVIIILSHPDGRYDSIGRLSQTKDGNQKISRLFHYDDEAVYVLRHHE